MSFTASLRDLQSQSAQQWLDRATRTLPQALSVVLVIAIAWQLVQLTWMLLEPPPQAEFEPLVASSTPPSRPKGVDVQAIVNAKLFGTAEAGQPVEGPAPETQLPLVLSAVFAADDPQKGLAVIGDSAQQAKVFAVGDAVRSGTKLHSVYVDRVILDRNGALETLALPKRNTSTMTATRAPAPPPQSSRFAENLRNIAETNPTAFAEIVRPQPVFANGVQRGYRVYPGRNRQQFAKLGLQPGDLVLSINGTPLDDPQRGMEIFNTIGSSDRVQVTVERNGEPQDLTLNTAQISLPDPKAAPSPIRGRPAPGRNAPGFTPTPSEQ
jgi:general secretion pathway protein C